MQTTIWESENYKVWFEGQHDGTSVIVSFPHAEMKDGLSVEPFAKTYLSKRAINAIYILAKNAFWFQEAEVVEMFAAIAKVTCDFKNIITYGSSMGGYGALLASKALNATTVLAIAPQYSLESNIVSWETRWRQAANKIRKFRYNVDEMMSPSAQKYLFFDPYSDDKKHIVLFKPQENLHHFAIPFGTHRIGEYMQNAGVLSSVISGALQNNLDLSSIKKTIRMQRQDNAIYWVGLSQRAALSRPHLARISIKKARALGGPKKLLNRTHLIMLDTFERQRGAPLVPKIEPKLLRKFLNTHPLWKVRDDKLHREYVFSGFGKTMDFMQAMRAPIFKLRHHPNWSNVYNKLNVVLFTHDSDAITELDIELARQFEVAFHHSINS